jgi:hypothetical protein
MPEASPMDSQTAPDTDLMSGAPSEGTTSAK